jgi:hypothetical protein
MAFPAVEAIGRKLSAFRATDSLARPLKAPASRVDLSNVEVKNLAGEVTVFDLRQNEESQAHIFFLRHDSLQGEELFADTRRKLRQKPKEITAVAPLDINNLTLNALIAEGAVPTETQVQIQDRTPIIKKHLGVVKQVFAFFPTILG